jgi:hypothetical protein
MITLRHHEQIAAGRSTSFTWLKNSYSKVNGIGEYMHWFPESFQEPVFMAIQYCYVLLTKLPCPIWFWYRYASGGFILVVFCWSMYNSATYYIEVFSKRNQNDLDAIDKGQDSLDAITSLWKTASVDGGTKLSAMVSNSGRVAI